jgi:hypothetical protein
LRIPFPTLGDFIAHVIKWRAQLKMGRINTKTIIAGVHYEQAIRDRAAVYRV